MNQHRIDYSIVVPVYNSCRTLEELCERIKRVFLDLGKTFEIILVDDDSSDDSWRKMKTLREKDRRIKIIRLIRNFGQPNATLSGLNYCQGNYVITTDDDLQNPPEEIPKLIGKIDEGYTVVFGRYKRRAQSRVRNLLSGPYHFVICRVLGIPRTIRTSSFAICRSDVVKNALLFKTAYPFFAALMARNTSENGIADVEVDHMERTTGKSQYNTFKTFKLLSNLVISYSSLPVIWIGIIGVFASLLSMLYGMTIIVRRSIDPNYGLMGWNSLMVAVTFLGGAILMGMGIISEYLRRILAEVSSEKPYIVAEMDI